MEIFGNRIPYEYFITKGKGESNAGSKLLHYETGSYDDALNDAGIENCNVVQYTSVMPTQAKQLTKDEGLKRLQWGEVLECIQAHADGETGAQLSVAIVVTDVHDPVGKYLGGFACEYAGSDTKEKVELSLVESIAGMIERRGYGTVESGMKMYEDNITNMGYKIHPGKIFEYEALNVKKKHGSILVAICFVSYKFPVLHKNTKTRKNKKRY